MFSIVLTHFPQTETTKGTGGDIIILEEAAYVDSGFFYETVAPLMIVGTTTLIGISTLRDGVNFYTRLIRLRDKATGLPMFTVLQVQLACEKCKEDGKATDCVHMLHLVPRWQSSDKHVKLKTIMQDRPGVAISIPSVMLIHINPLFPQISSNRSSVAWRSTVSSSASAQTT